MLSLPFVVCCSLVITSDSFLTPWNVACQAPRSIGFSRKEYWNGLPFVLPGDLPDPEIEPPSAKLLVDYLPLSNQESPQ